MSVVAAQVGAVEGVAPAVRAAGVGKRIDERVILEGIDLEVAQGRFVALLGANGAGKSTLLKVLATLTPPSEGRLELFGRPVARESAHARSMIGLVAHQSMLYRDLSARENLEFFGKLYGVERPRERAMELLEALGLGDRAEDAVKTFSRGMTQRVAIARALVHRPKLLLADEPFEGLDAPSTADLEDLLQQFHEAGRTVILVNHDIGQSLRLAERAVVLRAGRVVVDAATRSLDVEGVLGQMEGRAAS